MGILEMFGRKFFGQRGEQSLEKDKKTEEFPLKKKRQRSKKGHESSHIQKEEQLYKKKKEKQTRESLFSEIIPVPKKKSWQEVIEQQKLVIFPITRNELTTTLSSVKALQEAILERRPDVPFRSVIQSGEDYKKILQTWLRGTDDSKITLFDTFLHRSNAQASRTEVDEDLLRVFQDSFNIIREEKERRPTFVFRGTILQYIRDLTPKHFGDQTAYVKHSLPSQGEIYRRMAEFFSLSDDKNLVKLEVFLRKAEEVSGTPENKKAIHEVVHDAMKLIHNEKKNRSSYAYRGKILAGIGVAPKGDIASRDEFKNKLTAWLKTAEDKNITPLENVIHLARERTNNEKVSEDVRQVIQDVDVLLSNELSQRKAREILKDIVSEKKEEKFSKVVAPPEEIQEVLVVEKKEESEREAPPYEFRTVQPNELRAQILQRIGSPDTEVSVGQGYFENRLREWLQLATTTDQQKEDALRDIQESLLEIELDADARKRKEKMKIFQRAEEILTNRQAI